MFEIIIFFVIALAVGYWVTLFVMGRRDDVLHGDFVQAEQKSAPFVARPVQAPVPQRGRTDSLQSLLVSIKRDLKDAAQI